MSVAIAILKIKEDEFIFKNEDLAKVDEKKLLIGFKVGFDWKESDEIFIVKLSVHYTYKLKDIEVELVRFLTTTSFHVKGLSEILKVDGTSFELPDFFLMTFVSTAISSGRGMLAYKLAGTFLADFYIPLIDPQDFIKNMKKEPIKGIKKKRVIKKQIKK